MVEFPRYPERLEHGFFECISAINTVAPRRSDEPFFLNFEWLPWCNERAGRGGYW